MRAPFLFAVSALLTFQNAALALERTVQLDYYDDPTFSIGASQCTISYYNRCSGWSWAWSGWLPNDRIGVVVETCCSLPSPVALTSVRVFTSAPTGYGFTGTAAVHEVDASDCPTYPALGSQPWLPTGPFDVHNWNVDAGDRFAIVYTFTTDYYESPATIGSDHPQQGPTGEQACGFCYPVDRAIHSYYWGSLSSPFCPGGRFTDYVCDAELIIDVLMLCTTDVSVESESWGSIKNLYR